MFNKIRIAAIVNALLTVAFNNFHNIMKIIQATINVAIIMQKFLKNSPYLRRCLLRKGKFLSEVKIISIKAIRPNLEQILKLIFFNCTNDILPENETMIQIRGNLYGNLAEFLKRFFIKKCINNHNIQKLYFGSIIYE